MPTTKTTKSSVVVVKVLALDDLRPMISLSLGEVGAVFGELGGGRPHGRGGGRHYDVLLGSGATSGGRTGRDDQYQRCKNVPGCKKDIRLTSTDN